MRTSVTECPARSRLRWLSCLLLFTMLLGLVLSGCSAEKKVGTVINFGQSFGNGSTVQSFVVVKLDDGSEVNAWLPEDDQLWSEMQRSAISRTVRVEIKRDGEFWRYERTVPKE